MQFHFCCCSSCIFHLYITGIKLWPQCTRMFNTPPDCNHVPFVCAFDPSCVCLEGEVTFYHYGWKDSATILFYFFIAIILHAVVQEYLLDVSHWRTTHRSRLSALHFYCHSAATYWLFSSDVKGKRGQQILQTAQRHTQTFHVIWYNWREFPWKICMI